jgi:hypothetical protein
MFVALRAALTDKRVDRQCEYRVEKTRRFLSRSRFQSSRTGGGDHRNAEEEEGRKEEALSNIAYVERRGRAALPQNVAFRYKVAPATALTYRSSPYPVD